MGVGCETPPLPYERWAQEVGPLSRDAGCAPRVPLAHQIAFNVTAGGRLMWAFAYLELLRECPQPGEQTPSFWSAQFRVRWSPSEPPLVTASPGSAGGLTYPSKPAALAAAQAALQQVWEANVQSLEVGDVGDPHCWQDLNGTDLMISAWK